MQTEVIRTLIITDSAILQHYIVSQKTSSCSLLRQMLIDFQNSFTDRLNSKFAI